MSILNFNHVSQSFGGYGVFHHLSASIPHGAKIGLVGPNGVGKTSLLLILAGIVESTTGQVSIAQGIRIGYLRQEAMDAFAERHHTVYQEMLTVFADVLAMETRLQELAERLADADSSEVMREYGRLQERFELAGGYEYELRIAQVLDGLGFKEQHWDLPLSHLSGGQKTRALLARLLLQKPDLLILDEPTNHLDVAALEWLESTLRNWDGALLIVSHDRYFLDRTVTTIWEMSTAKIEVYRGNYSAYAHQQHERRERGQIEWDAMMERFEQELAYIDKHYASQRHAMAEGKLKRVAREVQAVHQMGPEAITIIREQGWARLNDMIVLKGPPDSPKALRAAIKALKNPITTHPDMRLNLRTAERSGDIVLKTRDLEIGYPGRPLFLADNIRLRRLECAALLGPNGAGKTTLLRTLLSELVPLSGELEFGASVKVGYFAQAHDDLNAENTVLAELLSHQHMLTSEARHYLARYLFRNDDVFKPIKALSGGERGRLALALLALDGANFLLLDEPTNHLDIQAQEVLQEVLEQFDGTILLVSHDRYLVSRLATQVWDLRDGWLHVHRGSYQEFMAQREAEKQSNRVRKVESMQPASRAKNRTNA